MKGGMDTLVFPFMKADVLAAILELEYFSYLEFPNEECSLTRQVAKAGSIINEEILYISCFLPFSSVSAWLTHTLEFFFLDCVGILL